MYCVPCEDVADGEDTDDEGAVETTHGCYEENWAVDGVDLWVLESLDMGCSRPADLLQEPAQEGGWCVGGSQSLGIECYFPAIQQQIGGEVAIFVHYGFDPD